MRPSDRGLHQLNIFLLVLIGKFNSHSLYGGGSLEQGCGTYEFTVDADPVTKLSCNAVPSPVFQTYEYRDGALDAINNFCIAHDGASLVSGDTSTELNEVNFSATYASDCAGSGTYTIAKDTCIAYLSETVDGCDTGSTAYKHGGTVTDTDNCGAFTFHPAYSDVMACYPQNQDAGYISGTHISISPDMAQDAINQFCDRSGDGQTFTLDPNNIPSSSDFVQDTCTTPGYASCGYFYHTDGSRTTGGDIGDISIRLSAEYSNPNNAFSCSPNVMYDVQGQR